MAVFLLLFTDLIMCSGWRLVLEYKEANNNQAVLKGHLGN